MRRDNQDVMGEKPVKNDAGQLSLDEESKKEAWKEHYEHLLNVEFPWNPEDLSEESPVEGPSEPITLEMITKAITKMASGKATGPSGIAAEMLKPVGKAGAEEVCDLVENIISEGCIPTDWQESFIVNQYKGKRDALNRGRGTTDAIFIVRQLQEKHLAANKPLYMAFGSVLSPLLFIIVLEALSREFRTGCPWKLLYADDLMISAGSKEELLVKVKIWKTEMEKKGLHVNMGKTKIMESGINLDVLKKSGKYPCGVCLTGVGSTNAILCDGCERWVHKKCSGIKGSLLPESEFTCARCLGTARAIDGRQSLEVEVLNEKLEVVPEFCYLGDMLSAGGGCELAAITRCKCA